MAKSTLPRRSTRRRERVSHFVAGPASGRRPKAPSPSFLIPPGSDLNLYSSGLEVRLDDIHSPRTQKLASEALRLDVPFAHFAQDTFLLVKSYNKNVAIPAQRLPSGVDPRCVDWPQRLKVVRNPKHSLRCRCADCPGIGPKYSIPEVKHLMQVDDRFKGAKFRTHSGRVGKFQQILCPKLQPTFSLPSLDPVQDFGGQDHIMCTCCQFCSCVPCRNSEPVAMMSYSPVVVEDPDCSFLTEVDDDDSCPNLFAAVL